MYYNYKIKVVRNDGMDSEIKFGNVGTIHEVKDGCFKGLNGFKWDNDGKKFPSIHHVNEYFGKEDSYKTSFCLTDNIIGHFREHFPEDFPEYIERMKNKENYFTEDETLSTGDVYNLMSEFEDDILDNTFNIRFKRLKDGNVYIPTVAKTKNIGLRMKDETLINTSFGISERWEIIKDRKSDLIERINCKLIDFDEEQLQAVINIFHLKSM